MSYTVRVRELDSFNGPKDEVIETDDTTVTIESCKPDSFYSVEIEGPEGTARLQLLPILGEHGGEEEQPDHKYPRFKIVITWVMNAGKIVNFTAKAFNVIDKVEKIVRSIIQD